MGAIFRLAVAHDLIERENESLIAARQREYVFRAKTRILYADVAILLSCSLQST